MLKELSGIGVPVVGLFIALHGAAAAGTTPQSMPLTDAQMDSVAAGALSRAVADASADGTFSTAETKATATVSSLTDGTASGQVTALSIGSAGASVGASATLSLSVSYP
jgi:hypothetical protein